jgi:hypothetical protein
MLGSVGGAPGVDVAALFGVATTIIQGDFEAIEQALNSGAYAPWTAINYGTSRYAPSFRYEMPDPDAAKKAEEQQAKREQMFTTLEKMEERGMIVDQAVVDQLAADIGLKSVPKLATTEGKKIPLQLAPADVARVVRVREARISQGLPPLGDERDELFVSELEAQAEADAKAQAAPAPGVTT